MCPAPIPTNIADIFICYIPMLTSLFLVSRELVQLNYLKNSKQLKILNYVDFLNLIEKN